MKGSFDASDEEVARVLGKLGVDLRPSVHIEGVQICPMGKNVIHVTLNKNVEIEKFCNKDLFEVKKGVRISQIRASGQREVVLTVKGLHPNTLDDTVIKYLRAMGTVEKTKVIHDTFKEGPLAGIKNGDRKYSVIFRPDVAVGSTHVIDGQRVNFSFAGQRRFCYRCLRVSYDCPGRGVAKDCEESGGERRNLSEYMQEFWDKIGYKPSSSLSSETDVDEDYVQHQVGGSFTPKKTEEKITHGSKFSGVSVKWFPKKSDHGDIMEFLLKYGLPSEHENVNIKDNGQVIIEGLDHKICLELCEAISGQKFKDKKMIYCNGIVLLTPEKQKSEMHSKSESNRSLQKSYGSENNSTNMPNSKSTVSISSNSSDKTADFDFQPVDYSIQSKLLNGSGSDTDEETRDKILDASEKWLHQDDKRRKKKGKRKASDETPIDKQYFKKSDKKSTPTSIKK